MNIYELDEQMEKWDGIRNAIVYHSPCRDGDYEGWDIYSYLEADSTTTTRPHHGVHSAITKKLLPKLDDGAVAAMGKRISLALRNSECIQGIS